MASTERNNNAKQRHTSVKIITQNIWLIPFMGKSFLGREDRCSTSLASTPFSFEKDHQGNKPLVIVAVQEAWGFRCGVFKPILSFLSYLQRYYLLQDETSKQPGLYTKSVEPWWLQGISILIQLIIFITHIVWIFLPLEILNIISGVWCPKNKISEKIKTKLIEKGANLHECWDSEQNQLQGHNLFRDSANKKQNIRHNDIPPYSLVHSYPIMDSGLLLISSEKPQLNGFEPFDPSVGSYEGFVNKGLLWAKYHSLIVVTTHMTFEFKQEFKMIQCKQMQVLCLKLFQIFHDCQHILLVGDFNHFAPIKGSTILPAHATTTSLLNTLNSGNKESNETVYSDQDTNNEVIGLHAELLSGTELTNEDGCIDHVIGVSRTTNWKNIIPNYKSEFYKVYEDPNWHVSDHYKVVTDLVLVECQNLECVE